MPELINEMRTDLRSRPFTREIIALSKRVAGMGAGQAYVAIGRGSMLRPSSKVAPMAPQATERRSSPVMVRSRVVASSPAQEAKPRWRLTARRLQSR